MAIVQPLWAGADVMANVREHAQAIEQAHARVVVFPELSLTGYDLGAPLLAVDDRRLRPLVDACRVAGSVALVGAPIGDEDGREYIATLAVTGESVTAVYRKMWLHGAECDRFSTGEKPVVVTVDGWRLGLAICYDAAVPQHSLGRFNRCRRGTRGPRAEPVGVRGGQAASVCVTRDRSPD